MKHCLECNKIKPLSEFGNNVRQRDGKAFYCKLCGCEKSKKYQSSQRGQAMKLDRIYKVLYGITLIQYNQLLASQNFRCKICNTHQESLKRRLNVDHCHKTGKIRSLLCVSCNRALGYLGDNPKTAINAYDYLLHHTTIIERAA